MDSSKTNAVRSPAPRRLHAYEDLPRPAKHPLQSDADEESAPAKRLRSSDNEEEDNPEATVDVNGVNTQQIRHDQPQLQQREDREDYPPASKRQVNLMCRLKYNNTFRMGEQVVVVHTMNTIKKNKTGNPCEYSYNLRGIHLPAEMIANIFSHMGFRTLGKACMGKNTKASKMHGKIVVSSAELKRRFHEHDLHTFFLRNGIPYSPAMAATLGVNSSWAYVLVLFRFMLEKGCHGCGAGVYIGCHYWAFGQNFCGNCLKDKLIHYLEAHQIFAWSFGNSEPGIQNHQVFDLLLEGTPHSTMSGRACDRGNTNINHISHRWFLREHVEGRIREFIQCMFLCRYWSMTMTPWQVFESCRFCDLTCGLNPVVPNQALNWVANRDKMVFWLEFARMMENWAEAHDRRDA